MKRFTNRNDKTYKKNDVVEVHVRLDRPAADSKDGGEVLYWALLPSDDFTQAGPTGTPYNKNASRNEITVSPGTQTVIINFQVATCSGSQLYNVKFITWKPDPYDDTTPNRKETTFKLKGDEHNEP